MQAIQQSPRVASETAKGHPRHSDLTGQTDFTMHREDDSVLGHPFATQDDKLTLRAPSLGSKVWRTGAEAGLLMPAGSATLEAGTEFP
jgi:hypothetical protein